MNYVDFSKCTSQILLEQLNHLTGSYYHRSYCRKRQSLEDGGGELSRGQELRADTQTPCMLERSSGNVPTGDGTQEQLGLNVLNHEKCDFRRSLALNAKWHKFPCISHGVRAFSSPPGSTASNQAWR